MIDRFLDVAGGFFTTAAGEDDHLPVRPKSLFDGVMPSGSSAACMALLRLAAITGEERWRVAAVPTLRVVAPALGSHAPSFGYMLSALDLYLASPMEIVIVGRARAADTESLKSLVSSLYLPSAVVLAVEPETSEGSDMPLLSGKHLIDGGAAAYLCERFACRNPVTDPADLSDQLARSMQASTPG
jgi:uncharacterized protein YyaL (SSP411 family)